MLKQATKRLFGLMGLRVEWRDRLAEQIPSAYPTSPYLPRLYQPNLRRILYFQEMVERTRHIEGDFVECGVSVGHGLLCFVLLHEIAGIARTYYGFDSFEGFPDPSSADGRTHAHRGFYASPPEIVERVMKDGQVPELVRRERIKLVKGFFDVTLPNFDQPIALLHLDCDLYESYRASLEHLFDKVRPQGIVLFDEYEDPNYPGARRAIDEFFCGRNERVEQHRYGQFFVVKK